MELAKIEQLLETYFEGQTSLEQEQQLRDFFMQQEVPAHLQVYQPMFAGFRLAEKETADFEIQLPKEKINSFWFYRVAASAVIFLGLAGFFFTQGTSGYTEEEQLALQSYEEVRQTMMLLSRNLNQGAESVQYLDSFNTGTKSIGLIGQLDQSRNKVFK